MGQNYGAGKKDRMQKSYMISMLYAFLFALAAGALLLLFGRPFLSLFTGEPAVIEAGMKRLSIMAKCNVIYTVTEINRAVIKRNRHIFNGCNSPIIKSSVLHINHHAFLIMYAIRKYRK